MARLGKDFMDRLAHRIALRHWARIADNPALLDIPALRDARARARALSRAVDRFLQVAEARLARPLTGSNAIETPLNTDWAWRPEVWRGPIRPAGQAAIESKARIGDEMTVFHDCTASEITIRQLRNTHQDAPALFGLQIEVFGFDGSFLSLVIDLPREALGGITRDHVVRLSGFADADRPARAFARLNIRHGPNNEQLVREIPLNSGNLVAEFDLAYTRMNEKRVEKMWVDLILEDIEMNRVILRDMTFSRRPRAALG